MEKVYEYGYWLPPDVSVHGYQIDNIINWMHWFMLVLFIGWGAFLVYTLVRFRARPGVVADYRGAQTHVSTWRQAVCDPTVDCVPCTQNEDCPPPDEPNPCLEYLSDASWDCTGRITSRRWRGRSRDR